MVRERSRRRRSSIGIALIALVGVGILIPPGIASPADPPSNVPPYLDAMDGIVTNGQGWNVDPTTWPHSATIEVRDSPDPVPVKEAQVKLRIEGKGDPINGDDLAGTPPKSGAPMVRFRLTGDIEVVPNSFACDSASCTDPTPSNLPTILPGNRGLQLEWSKPVSEIRIKGFWQVSFLVRSYSVGAQVIVNQMTTSFVEYDRYGGSPGGSDVFEQLYAAVTGTCPGVCSLWLTPQTSSLQPGATQQFTAQAFDSGGQPVLGATYAWSVSGGIGNVSTSGLFAAVAPGAGSVDVVASYNGTSRNASAPVEVDATAPAVTGTNPPSGAVEVRLNSQIRVSWSEPMNTTSTSGAFSSTPTLACAFSWSGQRILTCAPSTPLQKNSQYCVTLSTGAKDLAGNQLASPYTFCFETAREPRIISSSPANNTTGVSTSSPVALRFNVPMDRASTGASLVVAPSTAGSIVWNSTGDELTFRSTGSLRTDTLYRVSVGAGALSSAGLPILPGQTIQFRTRVGVPPFLDAMDGVAAKGDPWPPEPANWNHSASVVQRGSPSGVDEAMVRLRVEGRGEPVLDLRRQQVIHLIDDSFSMGVTDPNHERCAAVRWYIDQLQPPDESGFVKFDSTATLVHGLSANYDSVKGSVNCAALVGGADIYTALRLANDELIPKKKAGFIWAFVLVTDSFWSGTDPKWEVNRSANGGIRLYTVCFLGTGCNPAELEQWANATGGKHYNASTGQIQSVLQKVLADISVNLSTDVAGRPPMSGVPMVAFKATDDVEVVPNSFVCDSSSCMDPRPSNGMPAPGNKGSMLEWTAPVAELRINEYWQVSFLVRSYTAGQQVRLNDMMSSIVNYDRYNGSSGSDVLEQMYLDVAPSPCQPSCLTRIEVTPAIASVVVGNQAVFAATAYDQNGLGMNGVVFDWGVNGSIGAVDQNGVFVAQSAGQGEVWVRGLHGGVMREAAARVTVVADTTQPWVVSTTPADAAVGVAADAVLEIAWSEPMDKASAEASFSSAPAIGCVWKWPSGERQVCEHTTLDAGVNYSVSVSPVARDLAGNPSASPHVFGFIVAGTPRDLTPPAISHTPPEPVDEGTGVLLEATITDDGGIASAVLKYRVRGSVEFKSVEMSGRVVVYEVQIPGSDVRPPAVEYYIEAVDPAGNVATSPSSAPSQPYAFKVRPRVETVPPGSGGSTQPLLAPLLLLVAALAISGAAFALVYFRRRRRRRSKVTPAFFEVPQSVRDKDADERKPPPMSKAASPVGGAATPSVIGVRQLAGPPPPPPARGVRVPRGRRGS